MAENKKSFVLYCDILNTVEMLTDEQAGSLFKHLLRYVNDMNPELNDLVLKVAFEPIKLQLKRDLVRYEDKKVKWSEAGKRSAELRKANECQQTSTNVDSAQGGSTDSTVTVTDNVTDTVTVINKKKEADFLSKIITAFQNSYFDVYGSEYILMSKGKERAAASKILELYKKKYPNADSETVIAGLSAFFTSCCMIQDDWLRQNMSLPLIVSKFNEINNILKNGKNKQHVTANLEQLEAAATAILDRYK